MGSVGGFLRANGVGVVALFVALSGTAVALQANSIKSRHIKNGQVRTADLGSGAVTSRKVAMSAIGAPQLADRTVSIDLSPGAEQSFSSAGTLFNVEDRGSTWWVFEHNVTRSVYHSIAVPGDWDRSRPFSVSIYWHRLDSADGDVRWRLRTTADGVGQVIGDINDSTFMSVTVPEPAQALTPVRTSIDVPAAAIKPADDLLFVELSRQGSDPVDTGSGPAYVSHVTIDYSSKR